MAKYSYPSSGLAEAKKSAHFKIVVRSFDRVVRLAWRVSPGLYLSELFTNLILGLLPLGVAYLAGRVVSQLADLLIRHATDFSSLFWLVGGLAILQLLYNQLGYFESYIDDLYSLKFDGYIWEMLLMQYSRLDQTYYDDPEFNNQFNKIQQNVFAMRNLSAQTFNLLSSLVQVIATGIALATLQVWLVVVVLVTLTPVILIEAKASLSRWKFWDRRGEDFRMQVWLRNALTDNGRVREIKLYGLTNWFTSLWREKFEIARSGQIAIARKAQRQRGIAGVLDATVQVGIQIWLIKLVISLGTRGLGQFVFFRQIIQSFSSAGSASVRMLQLIQENSLYVDDYFDFMTLNPRLLMKDQPVKLGVDSPTIEFRDVSFRYPGAKKWALRNLNLVIEPGQDVAIIGENGAGKTTFVKLLMRLYDPVEGSILIDGIDLRDLNLTDWNSRIGVLFQDFNKYGHLTLGQNILVGDIDRPVSDANLNKAIDQAGGDNFRSGLTNGLDQILTNSFEGGIDLSGGQWQRVALARAFYRSAPILVLDEPTSAIDAKGEYEIFQQIAKVQTEKTTIIISHRFSTVRNAQHILVLDKGKMTESGSHDELMKLPNGRYRELFDMQAAGYR